jgi:hypothetical protein
MTIRPGLAGSSWIDRRRHDTGMLHTGHTFGDDLAGEQRLAVLEFLKCL